LAYAGGAVAAAAIGASSYRVKFRREEFLELVDIAKPRIIYQRGRMHFLASTASSYTRFSVATRTSRRSGCSTR